MFKIKNPFSEIFRKKKKEETIDPKRKKLEGKKIVEAKRKLDVELGKKNVGNYETDEHGQRVDFSFAEREKRKQKNIIMKGGWNGPEDPEN